MRSYANVRGSSGCQGIHSAVGYGAQNASWLAPGGKYAHHPRLSERRNNDGGNGIGPKAQKDSQPPPRPPPRRQCEKLSTLRCLPPRHFVQLIVLVLPPDNFDLIQEAEALDNLLFFRLE